MDAKQKAAVEMKESEHIRKSALLLERWGCDVVASFTLISEYDTKEVAHAAGDVGRAYLAEHPADDGEPVTEEWLFSVGFDVNCDKAFTDVWNNRRFVAWYPKRQAMSIYDQVMVPCSTRGDVRRLCRALGIELKPA